MSTKALQKEIRAEQQRVKLAKARALAAKLKAARLAKRHALQGVRAGCRAERARVSASIKARRAKIAAEIKALAAQERHDAKSACRVGISRAVATVSPALETAKADLAAERAYLAELRRLETAARARERSTPRPLRQVRSRESDDEVRQNIPPELLGLFERVRRSVKGSPRMSRTEAFLKYAEEHAGESGDASIDAGERLMRELDRARVGRVSLGGRTFGPKSTRASLAAAKQRGIRHRDAHAAAPF